MTTPNPAAITLILSLSAANFLTFLGIAVKIWYSQRGMRITGQPIEITPAPEYARAADCKDHRINNENDHQNLFFRMSSAEQRLAANEATVSEIRNAIVSIDGKLTALLRRKDPPPA